MNAGEPMESGVERTQGIDKDNLDELRVRDLITEVRARIESRRRQRESKIERE